MSGQPRSRSSCTHEKNKTLFTEAICAVTEGHFRNISILISAESIFPIARRDEHLAIVADYLYRYFSEIMVVVYLREPSSWMYSRIQQALKNARPLDRALNNAIASTDFVTPLRNLTQRFGESRMLIRSFDSSLLIDGDVLTDFCLGGLGMPDSPLLRWLLAERRVTGNYGISAEMMKILVCLYRDMSITHENVCSEFTWQLSRLPWVGHRFGSNFFTEETNRRLKLAADHVREEVSDYLGHDYFPSYQAGLHDEDERVRTPKNKEIRALRRNAEVLKQAILGLEPVEATGVVRATGGHDRNAPITLDEARHNVRVLLEELYERCSKRNSCSVPRENAPISAMGAPRSH